MPIRRFVRQLSPVGGTVLTLLLQSPVAAVACPMCYGSSSSRVLDTYYLSTLMLSLLPFCILGVIAGVALHMKRRARGRERRTDGAVLGQPIGS